ncbi:MAG: radical SAM protein [Clostridiales bacterium]|nr:radical SAM protein [Clostridiales bacterium]
MNDLTFIDAKSILSPYMANGWFGAHYNMNLYRGCPHGCIYCFSRNECYQIDQFDRVRGKKNALAILEQELKKKRKSGAVLTGSMSDPYNPYEAETCTMRGALSLFNQMHYGAIILTKSDLVLRDIDLLCAIKTHSPVAVNFTITCAEDSLSSVLEPFVCPSSARFRALKTLAEAGIPCGILLMPILPFINDTLENIIGIVEKAALAGAKWIEAGYGFCVTLRANQRQYFYEQLDHLYPDMKERYIKAFGKAYSCYSPHDRELKKQFRSCCEKHHILYQSDAMARLIHQDYETVQLSFFD